MFKVAICDDRPEEMSHLENMLLEYQKENGEFFEIHCFNNGISFLEALKNPFDICFLDIFMPGITGIDVAKDMRKVNQEIELVFTTSSIDFAIVGYQVRASNYLVKPISKDQLFAALWEILDKVKLKQSKCICVNTDIGVKRISVDSIAVAVADKHSTTINLRNQDSIHTTMGFGEICEMLVQDSCFYVVSRSAIVNFNTVLGTENDMLLIENGDNVIMPRRKKQEITNAFLNFHTGKLK